jgi:cytochrome c oxidase subunit IV
MVSIKEVKTTIAVAIGGAFGFVIALIWKDIIVGLMNMAGLSVSSFKDITGAAVSVVMAIIVTVVCVFGIIYAAKLGGVTNK